MNTTQPRAMTSGSNEALLRNDRQGTPRRQSISIPPGGGTADATLVHYGTDPDLVAPTKPRGSSSGLSPGGVSRGGGRQIVDLDEVHAESNARRRAVRSTSPRFCATRAQRGARNLAENVAQVAMPLAASGTVMTGATACGATIMREAAGAVMETVPYVGATLRPAAEVLGAMNGAAAGAATGAVLAQALPSGETLVELARAATNLIGEVVEAAGDCASRAPSRASSTARTENLFVNDVNSLESERPIPNNNDHLYDTEDATNMPDENANTTNANAHEHDMQQRSDSHPVFMPLTPDHDRFAVIEAQMSHTQLQMSQTQSQMAEMMKVMMTKFSQFEQGLSDTTEEVVRQRDVRGSTGGRPAPPAPIPEHEPITENDQESSALRNGQCASDAFGVATEPAKGRNRASQAP